MAKRNRQPVIERPVENYPVGEFRENKKGFLEITGAIEEVLPDARFRVKLSNEQEILCHLSGRMRVHNIRVIMGDSVLVEISPYDLTKGRITRRL